MGAAPAGGTLTGTALCSYTLSTFFSFAPCASLRQYKSHVRSLGLAVPEVLKLHPVSYTLKATGEKQLGFIAEEVEKVDPRNSTYDRAGKLIGVQYSNMVALLTKAIQEQQAEIEALKKEIAALASR